MTKTKSRCSHLLLLNPIQERILQLTGKITEHVSEVELVGVLDNPNNIPPSHPRNVPNIVYQRMDKLLAEVAN